MSTTTILYRDIAPGAIDGAQITATEATPFSDPSMLADDEHYVSQAATLERNVWTLDGTPSRTGPLCSAAMTVRSTLRRSSR